MALLQLPAQAQDKPAFKDDREKASYAVGAYFGNMIKANHLELDMDVMISSLKDAAAGHEAKLTREQIMEAINTYQRQTVARIAEQNKKAGEAFLLQNKTNAGVKTLTISLSGDKSAELQYKELVTGTNALPGSNDIVTVNLRSTSIEGKELENSPKRKFPMYRYPVRGISEAIAHMTVGSKWTLYMPSAVAYGDAGRPGFDPGATIITEVELVSAEPPPAMPPAPAPAQPLTSDIIKVPSAEELKKGAKIEVIKPEDAAKQAQEMAPKPAK